jgi:hypothetical protein
MIPGLFDDERRSLARVAAMLACGAACVLPLTAQTSMEAGAAGAQPAVRATLPRVPGKLDFPPFSLKRDPFVPDPSDVVATAADAGDAEPEGLARSGGTIVRAVVVGENARALVEIDGAVSVVGIGDKIGNATVERITTSGIALSDGTQLGLQGNHN